MTCTSLTQAQQQLLLNIAKDSIAHGLAHGRPLTVALKDYPAELQQQRATFVTLQLNGQLRGCIGMLEAVRPLAEDVAGNAFSAAFKDPRFRPVSSAEYSHLELHISMLTPATQMSFHSEEDLISQLRPNIDGLIMQEGGRRGTFLPSVWESLPEPRQFLQQLKLKSGLPQQYWSDTLQVYRYGCEMIP